MAELTPCIDCGHQISKLAIDCPKCQSSKPHGVHCLICQDDGGIALSIKKAHRHPHDQSNWGYRYYHPECVKKVLAIPINISCPECAIQLSQSWSWEELCERGYVSCKNCGVLNVFGSKGICEKCSLPTLGFNKGEVSGSIYSAKTYHELCLRVVRRLEEQKQQEEEPKKASVTGRVARAGAIIGAIIGLIISLNLDASAQAPPILAAAAGAVMGLILGVFICAFIESW